MPVPAVMASGCSSRQAPLQSRLTLTRCCDEGLYAYQDSVARCSSFVLPRCTNRKRTRCIGRGTPRDPGHPRRTGQAARRVATEVSDHRRRRGRGDARSTILTGRTRADRRDRRRRHCRTELRAGACGRRDQEHGVRSVGPDRRTNVFEQQLLGRESGHRVVRRTHRHGPYHRQEAGQALRSPPGQPARRPTAAVRRHLLLLRTVLPEKPGRSGFRVLWPTSLPRTRRQPGFRQHSTPIPRPVVRWIA